jgi:hypothetical protein
MSINLAAADPVVRRRPAHGRGSLLTAQQMRAVEHLPDGHELVGVRGGTPIVRRPDGHLSAMRTSGRLVRRSAVQPVQSYLLVHG